MQEAGLTHGTFYSHFPGKDDLAAASFSHAVRSRRGRWIGVAVDTSWSARLKRLAKSYLSRTHRDDFSGGCAFAALTSDGVRAPAPFRAAYEGELTETLAQVCAPFEGRPAGDEARLDEAIALMALCIGGLSLARAVIDRSLSDRILRACRAAAERMETTDASDPP